MKYKEPTPLKNLIIVGDNFISNQLYRDFKRFSEFRIFYNVSPKSTKVNYIIDCSFNKETQKNTIEYSDNFDKILIINHWDISIKTTKTPVIQIILPDVYGQEHHSFERHGFGNTDDKEITRFSFISETLRRMNDVKRDFVPILYLKYYQQKLKYINVETLFEPILNIIYDVNENKSYELYENEENCTSIISLIKNIIEYEGVINFESYDYLNNKTIERYNVKKQDLTYLENKIRQIYNYLKYNNDRFKTF